MKTSKTCLNILILFLFFLKQSYVVAQNYYPDKYKSINQTITSIRIASASIIPDKWEKGTNWKRIEKMVRKAALDGGAKVIVTPEGILEGYVIEEANSIKDLTEKNKIIEKFKTVAEPLSGNYIIKACNLADELDVFLVLGFLESRNEKLYNTAILIDPDGDIIGRYSKTHFAEGYIIKPEAYTPGDEYPVFNTPFGKVGIIICYDRQLPEPARIMALKGAQILLVPAYGGYSDQNGYNTVLMRTRAYENKFPVVFCNPFQSLLIDQNGNLSTVGNAGEIVYYEVNTSPKNYEGRFKNRRADTYKEIIELENPINQK
jgi:beta-ureidopropionase